MTAQPPDEASIHAGLALRILDALGQLAAQLDTTEIARGSRAWSDGRRKIGRYTWDMAVLKAISAGDHLRVWRNVVRGGELPLFAQYSLLRTAFEASAVLRWLVDPKARQSQRIERGVAAQYYDFDERRKFEESTDRARKKAGLPPLDRSSSGKPGLERREELAAEAKKAKVAVGGVNFVDICRDYGPAGDDGQPHGEVLYRLFSSFAHGTQWAVLPLGDMGEIRPTNRVGSFTVGLTANSTYTLGATAQVVELYRTALDELLRYAEVTRNDPR